MPPNAKSGGGQNRVLPPPPNIGEKCDKKAIFSRRRRRREKIFLKNLLFSEILPPTHNFTHLRLCPPSDQYT